MATGDKTDAPITGRPEVELADGSKVTDWAALMGGAADETSVAEYKVAWGGSAGGSNASSSSPYYAPDDTITLDKDGDYTFDVLPYQKTLSQEAGTMTGGTFYLKNSVGTVIQSLVFPNVRIDQNYNFRPYTGSRQTLLRKNMTAGTYRLGFTSAAGAGSGNRVSYEGFAHVIVRRASLVGGDSSNNIERVVTIKNPGFGTILGDFNFLMPGGGNRSLQIRTVSGTIAYTEFNTYWSAGVGGDNDAPLAGNWDETWRYAASFNLTGHNHYQHVEFIANGWFYHAHMVVGPDHKNNRFTLTRWRVA